MFPRPTANPRQESRNSIGLSQLPRFSSTEEFSLKSSSWMSFKVSFWARQTCACKEWNQNMLVFYKLHSFMFSLRYKFDLKRGQEGFLDNGREDGIYWKSSSSPIMTWWLRFAGQEKRVITLIGARCTIRTNKNLTNQITKSNLIQSQQTQSTRLDTQR